MLSGSAVLRVSLLLIVAGALAAFVQHFWPYGGPEPVETPRAPASAPAKPAPRAELRRVDPAPAPQPAPASAPQPAPAPSPTPPAAAPEAPARPVPGPVAGLDAAPPAPMPAPVPPPAPAPLAQEPAEALAPQAEADPAPDSTAPRAVSLVDLNTGSLAELNRLRGGGTIGRAIIQKRPYTAIDQLLSKRVLTRATYERIKDQVTVQ
ncbi:helix-hairpin-helix domain-containing protein [Methylobacterium durans]|uniref:ComEA family DNA-binding protein n=1 Tax=Methylobacterium durans TaxID=2202825 RepID=UPI002AFE7DDC|nr:helix-hairpin-helix domain-containing protein [Methylobacterium durans]MEA1832142.1 helix-hairpin-helix domain-containing protein [Methylobacterium durans]